MAKVLKSFEFGVGRKQSRYAKYLDGQIWEVNCKEDHPGCGSALSVLACINGAARRVGKKVRSSGVRDDGKLIVQVYTPE